MKTTKNKKTIRHPFARGCAAAVAAVLVCTSMSLHPAEAFAQEAAAPALTSLSGTPLSVRSYHGLTGSFNVNIDIPTIKAAQYSDCSNRTNDQILKITDDYLKQAQLEFVNYRESFLATGGTKEEWNNRTMDILIDYDVKHNQDNLLSLELTTATGWFSFSEQHHFYNLDLKNNKVLTLEDLLGKDYVKICNESILKQIKERMAADEGNMYFTAEEGGFKTITADTPFYLNSDGNVVISFPKYEIAPGAMGIQEFVIQK